jgi:eukaryotic-like serine/threonine-protein kinase
MEPLASDTLESLVARNGTLSVRDVANFIKPVCDALDYLHSKSILHRDIKPSNILFSEEQSPILADFGIAHQLHVDNPSTQRSNTIPFTQGNQIGTMDYTPPEVMNGSWNSPASDFYSLGITIYYALSGKLPSDKQTLHLRNVDRVSGATTPLYLNQLTISRAVSDVVMRMIDVAPTARYSTATAFASAFDSAFRNEDKAVAKSNVDSSPNSRRSERKSFFDYLEKLLIPIIVAIIGAAAAWLTKG